MPRHLTLLATLSLLLALTGCGSDTQSPPGRIDPPEGYAATADEAVRLLRNSYLQAEPDEMTKVLHPDFEFELDDPDAVLIDLPTGSTWDRAAHLVWTQNLFAGKAGIRADGVLQNPIDLDFGLEGLWIGVDDWTEVENGPLAGTMRRTYRGVWSIQYVGSDFDFVQGEQTFHVTERDVTFEAGTAKVTEVIHWFSENVVVVGKHETISWGRLVAKFRFDEILDTPAGYATSPDDVVARLQQAYLDRDLTLLGRLLHESFVFEPDPTDAADFSLLPTWDETSHILWTNQFFSGGEGTLPDQSPFPALDTVEGCTGAWTPAAGDQGWTLVSQGPYIQTLERQWDDAWTVPFADATQAEVAGVQTFNVVEGVIQIGEDLARAHQLLRWKSDVPGGMQISWGRLHALYRVPNPIDLDR